jgi:IMP dehydrogenase
MNIRKRALTFEDVLLVPQYSEVLPKEVNIESMLTRNIKLNIPMVSAAMDTVTEYRAAIAMAHLGGIGIIHKNMDIDSQASQVRVPLLLTKTTNCLVF